jgi:hypothetical protein
MSPETSQRVRRLVGLVFTGIACFVVTQLALHYLQSELNPLDEAMSYYVHGRQGWLLTAGLLGLGVASLALTVALASEPAASVSRVGWWSLVMWTLGVLLAAGFAIDPPGGWSKPPSVSGSIHGIAAVFAFVSFPVAALRLSRAFRVDPRWSEPSRTLRLLAIASGASLAVFFVSLVPVFIRPGPPVLLGLTERLLIVVYIAWLWVCAIGVLRASSIEVQGAGHDAVG